MHQAQSQTMPPEAQNGANYQFYFETNDKVWVDKFNAWKSTDIGSKILRRIEQLTLNRSKWGKKFGIRMIVETVRYEYFPQFVSSDDPDDYKINNNYQRYIVDWLIRRNPQLRNILRTR